MKLTVITNQRLFGHRPGSVIVVEDSQLVRGLIARKRLDLVDPPSLELIDGNQSSSESSADQELPEQPKRTRTKGSRKASTERSEGGEEVSSEGVGGSSEFTESSEHDSEGEADRSDHE